MLTAGLGAVLTSSSFTTTSLSDAGSLSGEMPSALPPAESMTDESGDRGGGSSTVNVRRREASAQESSEARVPDAANTYSNEAGSPLDWMPSSSDAGSPLGWMPSSSEAGSPLDWMPAASPPAALKVVLPASDACGSQKARG